MGRDGGVTQARIDEVSSIRGHLIPVMIEDDIPGRDPVAALTPEDFHKVLNGYACANGACLADFGGVYRFYCPVCHTPTGRENMAVDTPPLWTEHLASRETAPVTPRLGRGPQSPDAWLAGVAGDPDVEQASLSKLRKRRRG